MTIVPRLRRQADRAAGLTRRAYRYATVPTFRARGQAIEPADDPLRLLFRPATDEWFVDHGGRWYRPGADEDLSVLLAEMPVEFVDEPLLTTIPHAGEEIWVHREDDTDTTAFDLYSSGGRFVTRIQHGTGAIGSDTIRWNEPVHPDRWVELTAGLWAAGVRDLTLEVYLPPHDDLGSKMLAISVDRGGARRQRTVVIERGDPQLIPLFRGRAPSWGVRVGLHCQYPEPATDSRELGFQLVSLERRR